MMLLFFIIWAAAGFAGLMFWVRKEDRPFYPDAAHRTRLVLAHLVSGPCGWFILVILAWFMLADEFNQRKQSQ